MNWFEITKRFNNIPFKACSWDPNEGLDCLSTIILFMKAIGKDVSKYETGKLEFNYNGNLLNKDNYANNFDTYEDIYKAIKTFIRKVCIKVNNLKKGDIILFKFQTKNIFGIYLGQNVALVVFEEVGVKVIKIKSNKIEEIYRWE